MADIVSDVALGILWRIVAGRAADGYIRDLITL